MSDINDPGAPRSDDGQAAGQVPAGASPVQGGGYAGSGAGSTGTASSATTAAGTDDDRMMLTVTYIAQIAGVVTSGLGNLIAVILAYVKKDSAPEWMRSHYIFNIRTFWISLVAALALGLLFTVAVPLAFIGVGLLIMPLAGLGGILLCVWIAARGITGLLKAQRGEPHPNPQTWTI